MYFRENTSTGRAYLQIAGSRHEGAAVRQRVIATFRRIDELQARAQPERLLRSAPRPAASLALSALGLALPSMARVIASASFTAKDCHIVPRPRRGALLPLQSMV